jgi:hypothetical protein
LFGAARGALALLMPRKRTAPSDRRPGFGRGLRIADLMTHEYQQFFLSSQAAERAGDAEAALEYHRGIPMFARSAHVALLTQLAGLADEMPPWLWARWAAYQCTRAEDPGTLSMEIQRTALDFTLRSFYLDLLGERFLAGDDPMPLMARTCGEDWVFHQLCAFELGGLFEFARSLATGRLREEGGLCEQWSRARMGGFRIETSAPGSLVLRDLARDDSVSLLELGAGLHAGPEGWLIGRLVPTGAEPGLMFDTRPLPVDERTAREVAADPGPAAWVSALGVAVVEGRVDRALLQTEDRELVTDVPSRSLVEIGTPASALASTLDSLGRGRDEIGRAALRILRSAGEGARDGDQAPYVAAAVLNAHAHSEVRGRVLSPGQAAAWSRWADLAPEPARSRLQRLAELTAPRAA